jgi:predicted MFS family arabinose efflux permease
LTSPAFALDALIYIASLAILWFGLQEMRDGTRQSRAATARETRSHYYWKLISNPRVASFAPAWIAINAVLGVWINLTARVLTDKNGFKGQLLVGSFDSFQAGNLGAAYAGLFVLGILLWSLLFPEMKKMTVMLISTGGLFLTSLFIVLINHQPTLHAPLVLPLAALLAIGIMIQSGFTPAALAHLANITEDHAADRGAIMGLYSVFLGVGQFLGASIGGPFVDWRGADGMAIIIALLGAFSAFMLVRFNFNGRVKCSDELAESAS